MKTPEDILSALPDDLKSRISYGLHGGRTQYFIVGVDGTLAQLGNVLSSNDVLRKTILYADKAHQRLVKHLKHPNE